MTNPMSLADVTAAAIEKVLAAVADVAERDLTGSFAVDTRDDGGMEPPGGG